MGTLLLYRYFGPLGFSRIVRVCSSEAILESVESPHVNLPRLDHRILRMLGFALWVLEMIRRKHIACEGASRVEGRSLA